ncbi:MAG: hypothetical protein JXB45_06340 [Candidatus Krumholzibacteriota bacterium]|nr:hypothetical protein [Candidatus Krumholzibacteriota bacterium]
MRKLLVLFAAVMLAATFAAPAMATEARVKSLGAHVAPYIEDDYNAMTWYATLPSYANLVLINMYDGTPVTGAYGFTWGMGDEGKYGTLGLLFVDDAGPANPYGTWLSPSWTVTWVGKDIYTGTYQTSRKLYSTYQLMYGYAFEKFSLGAYLCSTGAATVKEVTNQPDAENLLGYLKFGLGARFDVGENYLDAAFDFIKASEKNSTVTPNVETDKGNGMTFRGRYFWGIKENWTLVPYVVFDMRDFANTDAANYGCKTNYFQFGTAANITVNEDNLIVLGLEGSLWTAEPSKDDPILNQPKYAVVTLPRIMLALETELTDWLTFRTGVAKAITASAERQIVANIESITATVDDRFSNYIEWNLGLGFNYGDFDIDCTLAKETPFAMGHWLTGYDNQVRPVGMISALYHF